MKFEIVTIERRIKALKAMLVKKIHSSSNVIIKVTLYKTFVMTNFYNFSTDELKMCTHLVLIPGCIGKLSAVFDVQYIFCRYVQTMYVFASSRFSTMRA